MAPMWVQVSGLPVTVLLVTGPRDCNPASTRTMIEP
jgi:hypothetical protein